MPLPSEKQAAISSIVLKQLLGRDQGKTAAGLAAAFLFFPSCCCADHLNHGTQSSEAHCKPNKEVEEEKEGEADKS